MHSDQTCKWSRETILDCFEQPLVIEAVHEPTLKPAAVLLALIERPAGLHVLLTRRSAHLRQHAGQISFPGGRMELEDPSVEAAALREAHEEVGLAPERVDVIGRLPTYRLHTGYLVHPVVAMVETPGRLRADPGEVEEIFEVPVGFILDPSNHQRRSYYYKGRQEPVYAMPYRDYYIWGATAAILREFYLVVSANADATLVDSSGSLGS